MKNNEHPAETYNRIRGILFRTIHSKGFDEANKYLEESYKKQLDAKSYAGMKAEIHFYKQYKNEFKLTVAGAMGEHADFAGAMGTDSIRFDVTTNIDFKKFKTYEPFIGNGIKYRIAFLDKSNFELIDVLDLAFKRCNKCGSHIFPVLLLKDQNYNRHGESTWSNDQIFIEKCNGCSLYNEIERYSNSFLYSIGEYREQQQELYLGSNVEEDEIDELNVLIQNKVNRYSENVFKTFRKNSCDDLMAIAEPKYLITDHKGGGYWTIDYAFASNAIASEIKPDIKTGIIR